MSPPVPRPPSRGHVHLPVPRHDETTFVRIDMRLCAACERCVSACSRGVLGMIALLGHRHVHVDLASACKGCLKCVAACPTGSVRPRNGISRSSDDDLNLKHLLEKDSDMEQPAKRFNTRTFVVLLIAFSGTRPPRDRHRHPPLRVLADGCRTPRMDVRPQCPRPPVRNRHHLASCAQSTRSVEPPEKRFRPNPVRKP